MIYVVGIGPGGIDEMTQRAYDTLRKCFLIAGYGRYIDLVRDYMCDRILYSFNMGSERERCETVLKLAQKYQKDIALISSGDAGVYGMAGLMLEVASGSGQEVEVVPGITASNTCAAILGAPLMNDYVTVSLSDIMTPWEVISRRLIAACLGDFVICLYNPASKHRPRHFKMACRILLEHKSPETPAGYVRNAGREGESSLVTTLGKIRRENIDMLCTIIIGNSQSYILDGKIITPRGYNNKNPNRGEMTS